MVLGLLSKALISFVGHAGSYCRNPIITMACRCCYKWDFWNVIPLRDVKLSGGLVVLLDSLHFKYQFIWSLKKKKTQLKGSIKLFNLFTHIRRDDEHSSTSPRANFHNNWIKVWTIHSQSRTIPKTSIARHINGLINVCNKSQSGY